MDSEKDDQPWTRSSWVLLRPQEAIAGTRWKGAYADDVAVVIVAKHLDEIHHMFDLAFQQVNQWMDTMNLQLAKHKTEAVLITSRKMTESDKALLDDNDSEEMLEHVEQDSGNTEKDPALQIKTEKTEDALHSLSQFRKGLMQQTNGNNPESSTKSSDIKDVKVSLERMKHFSTPVKPGQSMNKDDNIDDGKNDSKDDGADDDFKDKSEQTKIKIRSSEKMLMLGNKNLEEMKRLMLESNKQTQEMAAPIGKTARRLEEVSIAMLDALKVMTKGYQSELDREKIKAEAAKVKNSHKFPTFPNKNDLEVTNGNSTISRDLNVIKDALLSNQSKINVRRDYRLTQKSNYNIWFDYLKSELTSCDLLDVIDENNSNDNNLSNSMNNKKKMPC
ncbi:uncharacterized protein LOC123267987 [Cotesia glomerata]|uniref:uncharacterized protein LOC123267987 n=1 Tax=Cotesia glomerata TaxID=32391 RepID=UPI001D011226|nr:uncharacterized protein LOC123267987 [Cotesia glomerata]